MADLTIDLKNKLQNIANEKKVLLMSFIAPDSIVKTSPISTDYAKIKVQDLYAIEKKIEEVKKVIQLPKELHLIIQTPGGDLYASTKIAMYLQKLFGKNIVAFVPYEAASGGTILCLAAKKIVMDSTSNLTPIDPQVFYGDQRISVTSYEQALKDFKKDFGNFRPQEIPSPYQQLAGRFDPVIAKELSKIAWDNLNVAYGLLLVSQEPKTDDEKSKIIDAAFKLGNSDSPHSHIINADEASKYLNIDHSSENLELLTLYKEWISAKLKEETTSHIIDVFYPLTENPTEKENPDDKKE